VRAEKAQRKPACMSRLFLTKRRPTKCFLPEARVIGAEPAYDFWALGSANRDRSSPISASSRAPSRGAEAGEAEQDLAVGVLLEGGFGGCGEVVRSLAGGIQLLEQRQQLLAERVLDGRAVPGVLGAEDLPQARGLGVEAAGAAAALEGGAQLGKREFRGFSGVGARARITRASALVRPPSLPWKACRAAG